MNKKDVVFQNVYGTKAVSLFSDEGWDIASSTTPAIWSQLAWPYRGLTVLSDKLSSLPFEIMRGGNVLDSSEDYQNKVGFLPDLKSLLWLLTASQTLCGSGYAFSDNVGTMRKKLRYILAESIKEIKFEKDGSVIIFRESKIDNVTLKRPYVGGKDIIYFWMPDPNVEAGPPKSAPMIAAMAAAGVLHGMDEYVKLYWERGAIKAMMFVTEGNMPDDQQKNLLAWYKSVIAGIKNAFNAGIFNGAKIVPTPIGDGIEGLKDTELTKEKREDISTALGIPQSILFSTGASGIGGGGVIDGDMLKFMIDTIIPRAEKIAEVFNTQVFPDGSGYKLVFRPQKLQMFQKDEAQRATALNSMSSYIRNMSSEGIDPALGFDLLGYQLTDEQKAALLKAWNDKKSKPEPAAPITQVIEKVEKVDPEQEEKEPVKSSDDLRKWQRKAVKHIGQAVPFESDEIPLTVSEFIRLGLPACKDESEVKALFMRAEAVPASLGALSDDSALRELAQAITNATKAAEMVVPEPQPQPQPIINVTITNQQPPNGDVTVNVPRQEPPGVVVNVPAPMVSIDAPIVNVTNTVEAAAPAVNNVVVMPAPIIIPDAPKTATIETDFMTGKKILKVE